MNSSFIFLKRFEERTGSLTLSKDLVSAIRYSDGSVTQIRLPKKNLGAASVIISIAAPSINFWGLGGGITCEIPLIRNKLTLFLPFYFMPIPFGSNFQMTRLRQVMPAVKFYPGNRLGASKERYAIGLQLLLENGRYIENGTSNGGYHYTRIDEVFNYGVSVNNSVNYFPGKHMYFGLDVATGIYLGKYGEVPIQLNINGTIGYRF